MTKVTELCTKEPALRALVIQAAREAGLDRFYYANSSEPLESFYNLAYKAGEKAMQERAAKVCDELWKGKMFDANTAGIVGWISQDIQNAIRALEVK